MKNFFTTYNSENKYALLVGTGISKSANIPLANEIIENLKKNHPQKFTQGKQYDYADALCTAFPDPKGKIERRRYFDRLCRGKTPGDEHHLIAHLAEKGIFKTILTTNFDHLLEHALRSRCSLLPKIYLHDECLPKDYHETANVQLIKIHGDFLFDNFANLPAELESRINDNMKHKLSTQLINHGLIVIGYSGSDNMMKTWLSNSICNDVLNGEIWWVCFNREDRYGADIREIEAEIKTKGKSINFIMPPNGKRLFPSDFLNALCDELKVGKPHSMPFGINPVWHNMACITGNDSGTPRQVPPKSAKIQMSSRFYKIRFEINKILKESGIIWISGPAGSGKTTLLSEYFYEIGYKQCFYFNPKFSKNPVNMALRLDIESFANELGINPSRLANFKGLISLLMKKGVCFIFDDIECGSRLDTQAFEDIIKILIKIQKETQMVIILLASTKKLSLFQRRNLAPYKAQVESLSKPNSYVQPMEFVDKFVYLPRLQKQNILDNTNRFVKKEQNNVDILRHLSNFRFGETSDILCNYLYTLPCFSKEKLKELIKFGILEQIEDKLLLHDLVFKHFNNKKSSKTQLELLAKQMQEISKTRKERMDGIHYLLESEALFLRAGNIPRAITITLNIIGTYSGIDSLSDTVYKLLSYLRLAVNNWDIIQNLDSAEKVELLTITYKTKTELEDIHTRPALESAKKIKNYFEEIRKKIKLPYAWGVQLKGHVALYDKDYLKSYGFMEIASEHFEKEEDYNNWISTRFFLNDIIKEHIAQLEKEKDYQTVSELINLNWSDITKTANDARNSDIDNLLRMKALDNLATVKLQQGKCDEALELCNQAADTICANEGWLEDRAVILGNYFYTYLGLFVSEVVKNKDMAAKYLKFAEGFFIESNENFASTRNYESIKDHLKVIRDAACYPSLSKFLPDIKTLECILSNKT